MRAIGLGQHAAGDDGVGLAVIDHLRALAPPGVELIAAREATELIPLLETAGPVVIIDALVLDGSAPGEVVTIDAMALAVPRPGGPRAVSSHGMDLGRVLALARLAAPRGSIAARIHLVGVTIAPAARGAVGLSSAVRAAVPAAARVTLACLRAS